MLKRGTRNIFLAIEDDGYININFDDKDLDAKKSINNSNKIQTSNTSDYFNQYIR